jgi:26S proteasome regulatory subunit T5
MDALPPAEHPNNNGQGSEAPKPPDSEDSTSVQTEVAEMDTTPDQPPEETWDDIPEEIMELDTEDILTRIRLIDNDIKVCFLSPRCMSEINFETRSCVQSNCG